jgi:hypothetical protein
MQGAGSGARVEEDCEERDDGGEVEPEGKRGGDIGGRGRGKEHL